MRNFLMLLLILSPSMLFPHKWTIDEIAIKNKASDRLYLINRSVKLGMKIDDKKYLKEVQQISELVFDVWWKNRNARMRRIKNPKLALALVHTESNARNINNKKSGCIGPFQLELDTAFWITKAYDIGAPRNIKNPEDRAKMKKELEEDVRFNVLVGLCAFDQDLRAWRGNVDLAIISYKCGRGKLQNLLRQKKVTTHYRNMYAKVYRYVKFLDGVKGFENPRKYFKIHRNYTDGQVKKYYKETSYPRIKILNTEGKPTGKYRWKR